MPFQHRGVRAALLGAIVTFPVLSLHAQTAPPPKLLDVNRHGWFTYSGDHPVAGRWGVHLE